MQGFGGGPKERDHSEDLGVEERIIIKLIFNTWNGEPCTGFIWLRIGTWRALADGALNLPDSKNSVEFLDNLKAC